MSLPERYRALYPDGFPQVNQPALSSAILKQQPADFVVDEVLSFPFTDEGEHAYLQINKTGENTNWVMRALSKHFRVKERDIGFAGLKDRHAVTTQWFSLPYKSVSSELIDSFNTESIKITDVRRHSGKLRKGAIRQNNFTIQLRDVSLLTDKLEQRIKQIQSRGIPNYFDEQRFGFNRNNLLEAEKVFTNKTRVKPHKRRLYISAARSWLFNLILAERVKHDTWNQPQDGDWFALQGSKKSFYNEVVDDEIRRRVSEFDIHPAGPLLEEYQSQTTGRARQLEMQVLDGWHDICDGLKQARVPEQRRAFRVIPTDLSYEHEPTQQTLKLTFALPAGSYATILLREIVTFKNES